MPPEIVPSTMPLTIVPLATADTVRIDWLAAIVPVKFVVPCVALEIVVGAPDDAATNGK